MQMLLIIILIFIKRRWQLVIVFSFFPLFALSWLSTGLEGGWSALWWRLISILISLCLCSGSSSSISRPSNPSSLFSLDSGFHLSPPLSCPPGLFVYWLVYTDDHRPINRTKPCLVSSRWRVKNMAHMSIRTDKNKRFLATVYYIGSVTLCTP